MKKFNCDEVFNSYTENKTLKKANIFHLYDTGKECIIDNSGYDDSRHFRLIAFNSHSMEKCDLGIHDGIKSFSKTLPIKDIKVYADGSFFIELSSLAEIVNTQCVYLK